MTSRRGTSGPAGLNAPVATSKPTEPPYKSREMELKFLLSEKDMNKVGRLGWLKDLQSGRTATKNLHATYFDTPELELHAAKVTFRIRKEGRRWIQCVKTPENATDGAFTRREWEVPVSLPEPDISAFQDGECLKALPVASADRLEPAFETIVKRQHRLIELGPGQVVALDIDRGEVRAGDKSEAIAEIEMELVEGDPNAVFELALKLADDVPLHMSSATKASRGYQLRTGQKATWLKASKPQLAKDISAENALGQVIHHCIAHLRANEQIAANQSHIEGIHQMRVAARRLRSALSIYKKLLPPDQFTHFNGELKWLINTMGPARDWDVFLDETMTPLEKIPYGQGSLDCLSAAATDARDAGYIAVRDALASTRYSRLLIELAQWVDTKGWRNQAVSETSAMLFAPASTLACRVLHKRHKHLKKEGQHFQTLSAEDRHKLRIDVKKLRYATEFFASLFPEDATQKYSGALAGLQDGLGKLNDVAVAQDLLKSLIDQAPKATAMGLNFGAGMVIGWQGHVADGEMNRLWDGWQHFTAQKPFWKSKS